jgi:hypothetical protein
VTTHETRDCQPAGSWSSKRSLKLESTTTLLFETRKTSRYSGGNSNGYELTGTLSEAQDERDGGRVVARFVAPKHVGCANTDRLRGSYLRSSATRRPLDGGPVTIETATNETFQAQLEGGRWRCSVAA